MHIFPNELVCSKDLTFKYKKIKIKANVFRFLSYYDELLNER